MTWTLTGKPHNTAASTSRIGKADLQDANLPSPEGTCRDPRLHGGGGSSIGYANQSA